MRRRFPEGDGIPRKHGTRVLMGIAPCDFPTPLFNVVANCITICGSLGGNRRDVPHVHASAQTLGDHKSTLKRWSARQAFFGTAAKQSAKQSENRPFG